MLFIKRIFLLIPIAILLNGCFGGLASLGKILKISAFMHIFTGWGSRIAAIRYFSQEHTVTFYAIIIIILLIIAFVIYLEINSQGDDYFIRPYKVLLGISLVVIVIYIIASAPEQKGVRLEMFDYEDTPKLTIDKLKDPYEDEKEWLTNDIACQNLEEEKNKYYCIEIKYQCADLLISKEEPRFSFGEGHFQVSPFAECADQLREKFKIGIGSFEEEFLTFKSFLSDRRTTLLREDGEPFKISDVPGLMNKPQDIAGDTLRNRVESILESAFKTNEDDLRKVWSVVETQLIEDINKIIKQFYSIDNVVTNGFGDTRVPFYTQNFVNRIKRVKTSYLQTEKLTKVQLAEKLQKELDLLVNDLNKVNDQIDKITGHTDSTAKTVLERLNEKREKIQEEIFNLKYALNDSND